MIRPVFLLLVVVAGCSKPAPVVNVTGVKHPPTDPLPEGSGTRVLFIGNSLTAGHDLPSIIAAMAESGGAKLLHRQVTAPGASLDDHWLSGRPQEIVAREKWDFVVLQQGPSSLPESQVEMKASSAAWGEFIRRHGAKPAHYMVWPFQGQENGFALVSQSYRAGAAAAAGVVLPAGEAWEAALNDDPALDLYSADGLHARPAGAYLAGLVISHGLTGVRPEKVPAKLALPTGATIDIPEGVADKLRRAAAAVIDRKPPT